jgi:Lon protease-like protein
MSSDADTIEVALFPIPNAVTFPGTVFPLHVFEPRYRRLVSESIENDRLIGISHVQKTIHQPDRHRTLEDALASNQATYLPQPVFSAGRCEILDTTEDGRILAQIHVTERLTIVNEKQSLPYRIVHCTRVEDEDDTPEEAGSQQLRRCIHDRLIELVGRDHPDTAEDLRTAPWTTLAPGAYSFSVFQILQLSPDIMQQILESRHPHERLTLIWSQIAPQ